MSTGDRVATKRKRYETKTWRVWEQMKQRCYNPKDNRYHSHGARGIAVCPRWLESYSNFLEDMGEKPDKLTLERIDNDGDYSLENCKWATYTEQNNNKRNNLIFTINGMTKSLTEWLKETEVTRDQFNGRKFRGWSPEKSLFTPIIKYRKKGLI